MLRDQFGRQVEIEIGEREVAHALEGCMHRGRDAYGSAPAAARAITRAKWRVELSHAQSRGLSPYARPGPARARASPPGTFEPVQRALRSSARHRLRALPADAMNETRGWPTRATATWRRSRAWWSISRGGVPAAPSVDDDRRWRRHLPVALLQLLPVAEEARARRKGVRGEQGFVGRTMMIRPAGRPCRRPGHCRPDAAGAPARGAFGPGAGGAGRDGSTGQMAALEDVQPSGAAVLAR